MTKILLNYKFYLDKSFHYAKMWVKLIEEIFTKLFAKLSTKYLLNLCLHVRNARYDKKATIIKRGDHNEKISGICIVPSHGSIFSGL